MICLAISLLIAPPFLHGGAPPVQSVLQKPPSSPDDAFLLRRYVGFNRTLQQTKQLMDQNRFRDATLKLEPCLEVIPDHPEAHFLLAQMAYQERRYQACLAHIQASQQGYAHVERIQRQERAAAAAQAAALEATLQASLAELEQVGVDPRGCSGGLYIAREHNLNDQRQRGETRGDTVETIGVPAELFLLLGNCHYRLKQFGEAKANYQTAIESNPSLEPAWNNLIGLCLERHELAQAKAWLARANQAQVQIRPELLSAIRVTPAE
ncbi:tetratricopeptide repeat protein [Geothrix sp. PMB-07]|uniref:tetratricopeptide repeat protein n=1 Tax=Geothrix sp. PMB-07 TaxID=3068640 RepID=UPI0027417C0E|nr:tetratricopeptide repeat protein [Geothrix sp. PMB-07]WLT31929.1 tetratricopeptide repeat protein [Geothrix sp. PMB-07]